MCLDETGCVIAQAELGTQSGWSSTPTSSVVLYSLGSLLLLLVILVAGYKVSRQRVVSLHQDQSQSQSQSVRTQEDLLSSSIPSLGPATPSCPPPPYTIEHLPHYSQQQQQYNIKETLDPR